VPAPAAICTSTDIKPCAVNLFTAGNYAILTTAGVSTVPQSAITGDVGVSPIALTAVTGFTDTLHSSGQYATSTQVVGKITAADMGAPASVALTTAISDRLIAYNDAFARIAPFANDNLGAGLLDLTTITTFSPGVYKWDSPVGINADIYIAGSGPGVGKGETDVFIFKIAQSLTVAPAVQVILSGGALAKNIFWQVAGASTIGAGAHFEGIILGATSVTFQTGSSLNGRILAGTAVALQMATITQPAV
jgi:hypothetical protein